MVFKLPGIRKKEMSLENLKNVFGSKDFKDVMEANISQILCDANVKPRFVLTANTEAMYTDGKKIVVGLLPEYKGMSYAEVYSMIKAGVGHEASHIRWSHCESIESYLEKASAKGYDLNLSKSILNVIEDGRVERLLVEDLPGYEKHIKLLNKNLIYKDGLLDYKGTDIENIFKTILFLSKLNLHPKNLKKALSKDIRDLIQNEIKPRIQKGILTNSYTTAQDVSLEIVELIYPYFDLDKNSNDGDMQNFENMIAEIAEETYKSNRGNDDKSKDEKIEKSISSNKNGNTSSSKRKSSSKSQDSENSKDDKNSNTSEVDDNSLDCKDEEALEQNSQSNLNNPNENTSGNPDDPSSENTESNLDDDNYSDDGEGNPSQSFTDNSNENSDNEDNGPNEEGDSSSQDLSDESSDSSSDSDSKHETDNESTQNKSDDSNSIDDSNGESLESDNSHSNEKEGDLDNYGEDDKSDSSNDALNSSSDEASESNPNKTNKEHLEDENYSGNLQEDSFDSDNLDDLDTLINDICENFSDYNSTDNNNKHNKNTLGDEIIRNPVASHFYQEDLEFEEYMNNEMDRIIKDIEDEVQRAFESIERKNNAEHEEEQNSFFVDIDLDNINNAYPIGRKEPYFRYNYPNYPYTEPQEEFRFIIHMLSKEFKNLLQNDSSERYNQKKGRLNTSKIWKVGVNDRYIFKTKKNQEETNYAVYILIDKSGSMCDKVKYRNAFGTAVCIEGALMNIPHVSVKTVAFDFEGGSNLEVLKDFNEKKTKTPFAYTHNISGNSNRDGFAIRVALEDLEKHPAKDKMLIIISDGMPACQPYEDTTTSTRDVKEAVHEGRKKATIMSVLLSAYSIDTHTRKVFQYMYEDKGTIMVNVNKEAHTLMNTIILYLRKMFKK